MEVDVLLDSQGSMMYFDHARHATIILYIENYTQVLYILNPIKLHHTHFILFHAFASGSSPMPRLLPPILSIFLISCNNSFLKL